MICDRHLSIILRRVNDHLKQLINRFGKCNEVIHAILFNRPENQGSEDINDECLKGNSISGPNPSLIGSSESDQKALTEAIMQVSSNLASVAESLYSNLNNIESRFIQLGADLQSVYSESKDLETLIRDICESIGREVNQGFLKDINLATRSSLEELQASNSGISARLPDMDAGAEHLGKLCRTCEIIKRAAKALRIISLNLAMENGRSEQFNNNFAAFVQESRDLAKNMDLIAHNLHGDTAAARSEQIAAHNEIKKGLNLLQTLTMRAEEALRLSMGEVDRLMGFNRRALEECAGRSKAISQQINEIVVAIQFDDIARQQLEHIISALRHVERTLKAELASGDPYDKFKFSLNQPASILQVQAGQLRQVVSEIDTAYEKSTQSFSFITQEVKSLLSDIPHFTFGNSEKCETEVVFEEIRSGLRRLRSLMGQGYELGLRIKTSTGKVAGVTSVLYGHIAQVRDISSDLDLKALNALVMTLHLGNQGKTFGVLAREVKELSNGAKEFVEEVVEILESINSISVTLEGEAREDPDNVLKDGHDPLGSIDEGLQAISSAQQRLDNDFKEALQKADGLEVYISQARERLGFLSEASSDLRRNLDLLVEMFQRLSSFSDNSFNLTQEEVDEILKAYTMKQERDVHERIMGERDEFSEPDSIKGIDFQHGCGAEDDLGDNVDIF